MGLSAQQFGCTGSAERLVNKPLAVQALRLLSSSTTLEWLVRQNWLLAGLEQLMDQPANQLQAVKASRRR